MPTDRTTSPGEPESPDELDPRTVKLRRLVLEAVIAVEALATFALGDSRFDEVRAEPVGRQPDGACSPATP
jgi:hypothetical protein